MPVSDQGVSRSRYMLIPRTLIFVTRGDMVLLLRGSPTKRLFANRYNGLGGHVKPGEDVLSAARRELKEETGLSIDPSVTQRPGQGLWHCGTLIVDTGENPGICIFVFTGEYPTGEVKPSVEGTLHWVDYEEVATLPGVEDLPILVNRIRRMKRNSPPFSARSSYENGNLVLKFTS